MNPSDAIARELVSEEEIRERVAGLAEQIQEDFRGSDLVVVGLLTGTLMFLADLVRKIDLPMRLDFIGVSSYRDGTESTELVFTKELRLDVRDRDVLLVDDILDTGKTLRAVISKLESMQPRKINTCVCSPKKPGASTTSQQTTSALRFPTNSSSATVSTTPSNTETSRSSEC